MKSSLKPKQKYTKAKSKKMPKSTTKDRAAALRDGAYLHLNVMINDLKQVRFYLKEKMPQDINQLFQDRWTPLDLAIFYEHNDIIALLKAYGGKTKEELNTQRKVSVADSSASGPNIQPITMPSTIAAASAPAPSPTSAAFQSIYGSKSPSSIKTHR